MINLLTYILFRTVSKLLQIIGQICTFDRGVPLFDTLVRGEPINSGPRNLALQEAQNIALLCAIHKFTDNYLVLSQYSRHGRISSENRCF